MNVSQLLRGIIGSAQQPVDAKSLELKVGQVVKGIVIQLLAEQDAMVNIGGVPVRARLETPLQAGQMTLLQVQPESNNGQVVLKPLGSSNIQILGASLSDVINNLGLKDTEANRSLVQQLHAASIPLDAKTIKAFQPTGNMAPVNNIPQDQWTEASIVAYKKGLPLKSEIIVPLQQVMFGKALPQSLEQLKGSLQQLIQLATPIERNSEHMTLMSKLVDTIESLSASRVPLAANAQAEGGKVTNQAANTTQSETNQVGRSTANENATASRQGVVAQASSSMTTNAAPLASPPAAAVPSAQVASTTPQATLSHSAPSQAPQATQPSVAQAPMASPVTANTSASVPITQSANTPMMQQPTASPTVTANPNAASNLTMVTSQLTPTMIDQQAEAASIKGSSEQQLDASKQGHQAQEQRTQGAEIVKAGERATEVNDPWIKQLLKQLGVDHEHRTANLFTQSTDAPDADELLFRHETVKGLLLQLASSDQLPQPLKEAAQQIVQQITGQQLLLGSERGAPFSIVTMFVPIQHEKGTDTASVHIQSRRKQGGNLDADNCRLLFDLRMSTLGNTLVDVQVVNRIVSLQVHNDFPLIGNLLDSMKPEIEAAMNQIGFQFISMKNLPYPNAANGSSGDAFSTSDSRSALSTTYHSKPYKGVDFKV